MSYKHICVYLYDTNVLLLLTIVVFMLYLKCSQKRKRCLMDRMNQIIEVTRQSHHLPFLLSFLVGICVIRKPLDLFDDGSEITGDNVPTTLMDSVGR